jgi:hypothetical protein
VEERPQPLPLLGQYAGHAEGRHSSSALDADVVVLTMERFAGADGLPYGVSSSTLSASSKGEECPEMPMTPISASATGGG